MTKLILELAIAFVAGYIVAMGKVEWEETGYAMKRAEQQERLRAEFERVHGAGIQAAEQAAKSAGALIVRPPGADW